MSRNGFVEVLDELRMLGLFCYLPVSISCINMHLFRKDQLISLFKFSNKGELIQVFKISNSFLFHLQRWTLFKFCGHDALRLTKQNTAYNNQMCSQASLKREDEKHVAVVLLRGLVQGHPACIWKWLWEHRDVKVVYTMSKYLYKTWPIPWMLWLRFQKFVLHWQS